MGLSATVSMATQDKDVKKTSMSVLTSRAKMVAAAM